MNSGFLGTWAWCKTGMKMRRMSRYLRLGSTALAIVLCALVVFPATVWAIADPDSPPQVSEVNIYVNLLEEGDLGIWIDYYIDYAVLPDETVTEAYLVVLTDVDGATQIGAVAPYTENDKGYGRGVAWMYFTAAEVITYGLDPANQALHKIWLTGNPTLAWPGAPPKKIAGVGYWQVGGSAETLLTLKVLAMAKALNTAWGGTTDLIEDTALGDRLTTSGADYFSNVIQDLRTMAPNCFSAATVIPTDEGLDYSTEFGATIADGTGTLPVSPLALVSGSNTVTITGTGTFTVELLNGTEGTATSGVGGAVVTGSPAPLAFGTNTITVTLGGTNQFDITVALVDTQTGITDTVAGTTFDLSTVATHFGMSQMMFSGLTWLAISVLVCWAAYRSTNSGKPMLLIFDICIIGGVLLGMVPLVVGILLFIAFGTFTGYILFFQRANI